MMNNQYDIYVNDKQIDSICQIEKIPYIGEQWKQLQFQDYESKLGIDQYLYIRDIDTIQYIYTITNLDSMYKFKKRIVKKIKE